MERAAIEFANLPDFCHKSRLFMQRYLILVLAIGAVISPMCGTAATDDPIAWRNDGLIARFHFAGTARIAADPTATNLNTIAALPETAALREQTFQKLAVAPYDYFRRRASIASNEAVLIRPLLDDLFRSESFGEMAADTNAFPESVFALRLSDDRARLWSKNLSTVLTAWSGIPVTAVQAEGFNGWELKKHEDPNLFCFIRAGDWIVIGWGEDTLRLAPAVLKSVRETTRPVAADNVNWLDAWADWPALAPHHLAPASIHLPAMRLEVQGRKGFVRSELTMKFAAPLEWKLNPWKIPTNIIQNPLVSFTATRGLFPQLNNTETARKYNLPPLPDQVHIWALGTMPLQTYWVAPVTGVSKYFNQLRPGLLGLVNSILVSRGARIAGAGTGAPLPFQASYTNNELEISGMPFVAPRLGVYRSGDGEYLLGGLFPWSRTRAPLPAELEREINAHPDLVCYGWEYTPERLRQWYGMFQLAQVMLNLGLSNTGAPAHSWLKAISPKLGNAGTEVSLTAPDKITVLRNSTTGLTAFELSFLAYWLDSPRFPLGAYAAADRHGLVNLPPPRKP